ASADMPPPPEPRAERPAPAQAAAAHPFEDDPAPREQRAADPALGQMQQELRAMRDLMVQQYTHFTCQQYRSQQLAQAAICLRLQRLGLDMPFMRELLDDPLINEQAAGSTANDAWQQLMGRFSARIPACDGDLVAAGGVCA